MNILIDICHPAHVYLFKNLIEELKDTNKIFITLKNIPDAIRLLEEFNIDFINIGRKSDSLLIKGINQIAYNWKIFRLVRKNKIQLGIGSSITVAHVSSFTKMDSIVFDDDDDEVQPLMARFGHPFADHVLSPDALTGRRKNKSTIYYPGYHELAYLHPKRFKPDPEVLKEIGMKEEEKFFILRFNAFRAHHDAGLEGLNKDKKRRIIELLKNYGKVFITTEKEIDPEFKQYKLKISPEKIHSLIYYATMLIGDSQTMTSEAAVLGTPAVKINSLAGKLSIPNEIEKKYSLCFSFLPGEFNKSLMKIDELININDLKSEWQKRRQKMLKDKIDLSEFFVWLIKNYPMSVKEMKSNSAFQFRFR